LVDIYLDYHSSNLKDISHEAEVEMAALLYCHNCNWAFIEPSVQMSLDLDLQILYQVVLSNISLQSMDLFAAKSAVFLYLSTWINLCLYEENVLGICSRGQHLGLPHGWVMLTHGALLPLCTSSNA
jgi:hypothetical protein